MMKEATLPDGTTVVWKLMPSGMIHIGERTSGRLTVKLLKGDTEADAQRRVEAKILEKLGASFRVRTCLTSHAAPLSRRSLCPQLANKRKIDTVLAWPQVLLASLRLLQELLKLPLRLQVRSARFVHHRTRLRHVSCCYTRG